MLASTEVERRFSSWPLAPWVAAGFWEKYFYGDPDARDTFDRERER